MQCSICQFKEKYCDGKEMKKIPECEFRKPDKFPTERNISEYLIKKAEKLYNRDKKYAKKKNQESKIMPKRCYYASLVDAFYRMEKEKWCDHYYGEKIEWNLAFEGGKDNLAPAVDHIDPKQRAPITDEGESNFVFCTSEMNDAKNNLSVEKFELLCIKFLKHQGYEEPKKNKA